MSRFTPVFLPGGLGGKVSVTFGRAENACSRAGFLYAKYKGSSRAHPLERGSALHRVLQLATMTAVDSGEAMVPPELVKAIANEVLADPEYRCPIEEHDYLREAAYRWADEATFSAQTLVACETLFVLDVAGYEVRGKIDRADLVDDGRRVLVEDYKSSRAMPSYEALGRRMRDGRLAAKAYQLVLYALLLAYGVPVREEPDDSERGYREVREPFPVAAQAQEFELAYVFPGIDVDGQMGRRQLTLTRLELVEYLASLEAQMLRVGEAERTGNWPATSGTHCVECPCEPECPIPPELRDHAGTINTLPELEEAAERYVREKERLDARWKEIKRSVEVLAPAQRLRVGADRVIVPTTVMRSTIRDKDGMRAAIERARTTGEPYVHDEWEKTTVSTPITLRRLTDEELDVEQAPSTMTTTEGSE